MTKKAYYVSPEYRTNPLSHIPAPGKLEYNGLGYDNIHYEDRYDEVVQKQRRNQESDNEGTENYSIEDYVEFYGGDSNDMTYEEMRQFVESQEPDYND